MLPAERRTPGEVDGAGLTLVEVAAGADPGAHLAALQVEHDHCGVAGAAALPVARQLQVSRVASRCSSRSRVVWTR